MTRMSREGACSIEGCDEPIKGFGWCSKHYQRYYKAHPNYKARGEYNDRRKHSLYIIWWQRKIDGHLCESWLNFYQFVKDVSPKPDGNYFLVRLRNEPFGPDNFKWQEHLKRKKGESNKEWWARKRAARIATNPSMESNRNIKRVFGLTRDDYNKILAKQNGVCEICKQQELATDARTGAIKKLAVDHCHNSKKVRGLLCWRCNGTLGKVNDDVSLLQAMIDYLNRHKGT